MVATLNGRLKLRIRDEWSSKTARLGYEIFVPLNTYYRMPSMGVEVGDWQIAAVNARFNLDHVDVAIVRSRMSARLD
jgi:hypothetical protein